MKRKFEQEENESFTEWTGKANLRFNCCKTLECWAYFSIQEIRSAREEYQKIIKKQDFLHEKFQEWYKYKRLTISGKRVCLIYFLYHYGITSYSWYKHNGHVKNEEKIDFDVDPLKEPKITARDQALEWMKLSLDKLSEPSCFYKDIRFFHLFIDQKRLYNLYLEFSNPGPILFESKLFRLLHQVYPNYHFHRSNRLAHCNTCIYYQMNHDHLSKEEKLKFRKHEEQVFQERNSLRELCDACKINGNAIYLYIDAAANLLCPREYYVSKLLSVCDFFKIHIHGILNKTWEKRDIYLTFEKYFPNDPNFSLTILWEHLKRNLQDENNCHPETLYIQIDNSFKENKNRTAIAFYCLLLSVDWFKEINLYALPVGHTHDIIDQMFSNIRKWYYSHSLTHPDLLTQRWNEVYPTSQSRPKFHKVGWIIDWKSITNRINNISQMADYRFFKFWKDEKTIKMLAKKSWEADWDGIIVGEKVEPIILVSNIEEFKSNLEIPIFKPKKLDENQIKQFTTEKAQQVLTPESIMWWKSLERNNFFWVEEVPENLQLFSPLEKKKEITKEIQLKIKEKKILTSVKEQNIFYPKLESLIAFAQPGNENLLFGKIIKIENDQITLEIPHLVTKKTSKGERDLYYFDGNLEKKVISKDQIITAEVKINKDHSISQGSLNAINKRLHMK